MSCTLATAVAGDVDDVRQIVLGPPAALTALDLDGATVVGHVWPEAGGAATDLAGSVVSVARKIIAINLGNASGWLASAAPGDYFIEYEITMTNGRVWTWPSAQPDRISVREGK